MGNDDGGLAIGGLTKLIVVLAILGLCLFDGISILHTHLQAADEANTAAIAAAEAYKNNHDVQAAYNAAAQAVTNAGDTIDAPTFHVDPPTSSVTLVLHKHATTLVVRYIGPLRKWTDVSEAGTGTSSF